MNTFSFFWINKSVHMYLFTLILLTTHFTYAATPTRSTPISIKAAVMMAVESNRSLRIAERWRDEVRATADAATGELLPRIDTSYAVSRTNSPINVFGDKLLQKRFTSADFAVSNLNNPQTINNYHTDISITIPVYQGGALWAEKRAKDASARNAQWQYMARQQMTILHVIETFSLLREQQAERQAAMQALKAARNHLTDTEALEHRGLAIISDVMDARSHKLEAAVALESTSHAIASAQDKLQQLLGLPSDKAISTTGIIKLVFSNQSRDKWLQEAIVSQPGLQAARHRLSVAQAKTDVATASFRPTINLQATEEWNSNIATPKNANATIAAEIRMNLFSGGSDRAKLHAARAATAAQELEIEDLTQTIHNAVLTAWRNLNQARSLLAANRQVLRQSMESLRIRKLREQQGLERSSDVLTAQSHTDRAHANAIRARYALIVAKARLLEAAGQLTPEVVQ